MLSAPPTHSPALESASTRSEAAILPQRTYADQCIQVGEPWAKALVPEVHEDELTQERRFERILQRIQRGGWTLGAFLHKLFTSPMRGKSSRSQRHTQLVSAFLRGATFEKFSAEDITELMYANRDSAPRAIRQKPGEHIEKSRPNATLMARARLTQWAIQKVEAEISSAATHLSGKEGGFHLTQDQTTWDFIHGFSLAKAMLPIEPKASILLRVLAAAALPAALREKLRPSAQNPSPYSSHLSRSVPPGSGGNRKDPVVIIVITFLMLMYARNLHFSLFRKIAGIWLFSNNASSSIFSVLSRIGLSSSYTTILKTLRALSTSAQSLVREKAPQRAFLLIYDNINRMHCAWDPDLGQRDNMDSGTAATFVELLNCDVGKAFDPKPLKDARDRGARAALTTDVLFERINMEELNTLMALHCITFLITETPVLAPHQSFINLRFRTTHAKHRMPEGFITSIHPLATSGHDEGTTRGNQDILDDLIIRQLGMEKSEVDKLLIIVGGDQSTVEKIRTLQKFLADCPHGYSRYGWVLPLIQLWHMGWADLERILSTHWGRTATNSETGDMSSFYFINTILKRKIKDVKRPDYYPTQNFIFNTLKAEIIDCWKVRLGTDDLNAYFTMHPTVFEDLLVLARGLVDSYLNTQSAEMARDGYQGHGFPVGDMWPRPVVDKDMDTEEEMEQARGDSVLANVILRLRDSMLHYEFQHAISDGDIGRAMNVMAVWTFTFTGCGKNKYSNELLEIACNFQYEYSSDLQITMLNNWVCTFTEERGGCFPMDQMQEHNIKLLKKASQRRDASFGDSFYQDIVSYNIRAFGKASETMKAAVGIGKTGGRHRRQKKEAAMKELATAMKERQLHKFRQGRDFGHVANDDFAAGYIKLAGGKVKKFIQRTVADAGNIHADDDDIEESRSPERVPLPNAVVNGLLYCGGDVSSDESSDSDDE
ncbi:hypothetical protein B0H16DRAFT_1340149 [Mycena metata]|uniref:DUF6589 domain-containing protein n=1 Tax=Mycena metata TaxID=1033252 RepID=A0AAD7H9P6_9AGAR|nr:hypothetical protein B0H16DRAFT_1340149 [Mycena metata]